MTGRIITVRHGRPNLPRDQRISSREYGDWWARYDESGLHPDEAPPSVLAELARRTGTVLSSTLPRAVETAREVTGGRADVPADPLFVEAPLPAPPVPVLALRPGQWGVISRAFWVLGYAPEGMETHREAWRRVDRIAERLAGLADSGDVLLCAHGYLNWMLDRRLRRAGWRRVQSERGNDYWSWRIYEPARAAQQQGEPAAAE
jgi:broad specificity phosphatase PhoE